MTGERDALLCPACRASADRQGDGYDCRACGRRFPILHGIPDFRLGPDRYLSLEAEREKAAHLHEFGRRSNLSELVAEYYRITDDVPAEMVRRFAGYVLSGEVRGREMLPKIAGAPGERIVDVGCGSGGLVAAAAAAGFRVTGVDIALRWLVIAAKRLEEAGCSARLICADIERPPFPVASFDSAAAIDLIEHLAGPDEALAEISALLVEGGRIGLTAANRYTIARYPLAGLFGVGFLPPGLRRRYVTLRRGLDTLRYVTPVSPRSLGRALAGAGFTDIRADPLEISAARNLTGLTGLVRPVHEGLRTAPILRPLLMAIGPAFEMVAHVTARSETKEGLLA